MLFAGNRQVAQKTAILYQSARAKKEEPGVFQDL